MKGPEILVRDADRQPKSREAAAEEARLCTHTSGREQGPASTEGDLAPSSGQNKHRRKSAGSQAAA